MSVELGDKVTDSITGFTGVVTGLAQYLYGCEQAYVVSETLFEGECKTQWFDIQRLGAVPKKPIGGPQDHPPMMYPSPGR